MVLTLSSLLIGVTPFSIGVSGTHSHAARRWITANFARMARLELDSRAHVRVPRLRRHHQHRRRRACTCSTRTGAAGVVGTARAVRAGRDRQPRVHLRPVGAGRGRRGRAACDRGRGAARPRLRAAGRRRCAPPAPSSPWCPTGSASTCDDACAPLGVDVLTNAVDFTTGELQFPHEDRCCPCSSCGVCKQAPIKDAQYRGQTTVLVGDGASDRKAALLADVVFAKGPLAVVVRRVRRRVHAVRDARRRAPDAVRMKVAFGTDERTSLTDAVRCRPRGAWPHVVASTTASGPRSVRAVGELVASGECATGVLFCWTGTGASIAANKVRGVRAALCTDAATAAGAARVERRQRARDGLHGPVTRTQRRISTPGSHRAEAGGGGADRRLEQEPGCSGREPELRGAERVDTSA